jgi:HSP20 family protein
MLMRFDPLRDVDRLAQLLAQPAAVARTAAMPMDAYRDGNRFVINFDLPGVDPEAIELTVDRDSLTVRAERQWKPAEGQEVIIAERPQGVFSRQIFLSTNLDGDAMQASYDRGVLTLTIPLSERARPRRIEIARNDDRGTSGTDTTDTTDTSAADSGGPGADSGGTTSQPARSGADSGGTARRSRDQAGSDGTTGQPARSGTGSGGSTGQPAMSGTEQTGSGG